MYTEAMHVATLQTPQKTFNLLALDEVVVRSSLSPTDQGKWLTQAIATLSPHASGLIVEPYQGLAFLSHKAKGVGVALRLEAITADQDPLSHPPLSAEWGVEEISQNYAVAKLALFYHPSETNALAKKQFVAEIFDFCHHQNIDLLLHLRWFQPPGLAETPLSESQVTAVQELGRMADLLLLDPPADALTSATITAELDVPWLVALTGQSYQAQKDQLRAALESGAKGWVGGADLWAELPSFVSRKGEVDWELAETQITETVRDRMIELARITQEMAQ